jgi:hypothetical protein
MGEVNGRTHEPNLREVTHQLDDLKELLEVKVGAVVLLLNERHERYKERDEARAREVAVAFTAAEKAVAIADKAQTLYNSTHNNALPRSESDARWASLNQRLEEKFKVYDEFTSESKGRSDLSVPLMMGIASVIGTGLGALLMFAIQRLIK